MNTDLLAVFEWPLRILLLLIVANGAPVLGKKIFGAAFSTPLDGGLTLPDGRPLFGPSKTIRGLLLSLAATAPTAAALRPDPLEGGVVAGRARAGDVLSSFVKRRLGRPPSSMAPGLDQIPESLLPALAFQARLNLSGWDIAGVVFAFILLELWLSRLLFRLHLRDRPY